MTDEKPDTPAAKPVEVNTVLNTLKWVCVAFVVGVIGFAGYKAVKVVTKPAAVVGDAVEDMSGAVKSGSDSMKQSTSDLLNRLYVPVTHQKSFNAKAETAFETLNIMSVSEPEGVKDRLFRASNLGGNAGRVCRMSLDFGNGEVPVFVAADNEAYATSKALGSLENRLIRMVIFAGENDVSLNTHWNPENKKWNLKWKATTVKKPASDTLAEARIIEVLDAIRHTCN